MLESRASSHMTFFLYLSRYMSFSWADLSCSICCLVNTRKLWRPPKIRAGSNFCDLDSASNLTEMTHSCDPWFGILKRLSYDAWLVIKQDRWEAVCNQISQWWPWPAAIERARPCAGADRSGSVRLLVIRRVSRQAESWREWRQAWSLLR